MLDCRVSVEKLPTNVSWKGMMERKESQRVRSLQVKGAKFCTLCKKWFSSLSNLEQHQKAVSEIFTCNKKITNPSFRDILLYVPTSATTVTSRLPRRLPSPNTFHNPTERESPPLLPKHLQPQEQRWPTRRLRIYLFLMIRLVRVSTTTPQMAPRVTCSKLPGSTCSHH